MSAFYEDRQVVTPGDLLAEGNYVPGENAYQDNGRIYASRVGLVKYENQRVHVVALRSFYFPSVGDIVIGKVVEVSLGGWTIDIKSPYLAILRASDVLDRSYRPQRDNLPSIFDVGDLILAKVVDFDRTRDPLLTIREPGFGKITRGQIVEITPAKTPRLIGRKGSMIGLLKRETSCQINVGQNGLILVSGKTLEYERLALMAIYTIDREAHISGLTDRITEMIKKEKKDV